MFFVRVTTSGAAKKLLEGSPNFKEAGDRAVKRLLIFMQKLAFKKAPYQFGILRREIKPIFDKRLLVAGTSLSKAYAPIQEFGGTIRPKRAGGWLVWKDRGGNWHRARQVTIKPKRYFRDTATESVKEAEKIFKEEYVRAFR